MNDESLKLLNNINRAIIKFRGIYSIWSTKHGISYHEMLVLYTIREYGFCTQKQICESYLLPRQTINNVIKKMIKEEVLIYSKEHSKRREKAFVLTTKGKIYARPLLKSLNDSETIALNQLGVDKLNKLTLLLLEYDKALTNLIEKKE